MMAVTSREIQINSRAPLARMVPRSVGSLAYLVTFILAALAIYVLVGSVVSWVQVRVDDLRYGRPRTTHLEGFVGQGAENPGQPTRFIGMNIDRQVVVLVLPAGDTGEVRSLPGPYLFGANEDLTPVLLSLEDLDRDGLNDLIINVRNEQIVYLNRDGGFRLPNPEEQLLLIQELGP